MSLTQGIYDDIDAESYHNDTLTEEVSLSRSGIVTLLNETPAHFAAKNRRISPWPERIDDNVTDEQDLGTVCHALLLGRGGLFDIHEFDNWRTKAAQTVRDESRAKGRVPILAKKFADALNVVEHAEKALKGKFGGWPLGQSEQVVLWQRNTAHGLIWARSMMDHFSYTAATVIDFKGTTRCINDDDLQKKIAFDGLDIQASWYTEGINTVHPKLAGLTQFVFAFVEFEPPYAVRFVKITESWMQRARFRIDRAANLFAKCVRANEWPAYPRTELTLSAPSFLESKWEEQELSEVV